MRKREDPSLPLETLPSPVIAEDMKEELEETLKVSLENSRSMDLALVVLNMLGFEKSRVRLCDCEGAKVTGLASGGDGARELEVEGRGARRKRAWPVRRLRREMSFLKLETVASVW